MPGCDGRLQRLKQVAAVGACFGRERRVRMIDEAFDDFAGATTDAGQRRRMLDL